MGDVIRANFGAEREWECTRAKVLESMITVGTACGDDEALLRAKAECVYRVLREIVEDVPSVRIGARMPAELSSEQIELLSDEIRKATLQGIEAAMTHAVNVLMGAVFDLCTSKLGGGAS